MLDKKTLKEIRKVAIEIDHDAAFGGKSKGNKHLERVVRIARSLALSEGADLALTEAGAWLHDSALPTGNDYDPVKNERVVRAILKGVGLAKADIARIAECAASHEGTKAPASLEAQIVHDSDVIEKTGILGIIRHTWKLTNSNKIDPKNIRDADVRAVVDHIAWRQKQLRLPLSRKIAKSVTPKLSMKKAREIVEVVAPLAQKGVITERIVPIVAKRLSASHAKLLRGQIAGAYLRSL
jgi:HD superfamily phosphodiesterase